MKINAILAAAALAAPILARSAPALVIAPNGTPGAACTEQAPGTLEDALKAFGGPAYEPGADTIVFKKGTYRFADLPTNRLGRCLCVYAHHNGHVFTLKGETGNPADVVFDGAGYGDRAFSLAGVGTNILTGITFANFSATGDGGAILVGREFLGDSFFAIIENCTFRNNRATRYGAAIASRFSVGGSHPWASVRNCTFEGNAAPEYWAGAPDTTVAGWRNIRPVDSTIVSWSRDVYGREKGPFVNSVTVKPGEDLAAARDKLRANRSRTGRAEIVLADGYHVLTNEFFLGGLDSRVTVRAEHPGRAVLTAGRLFRGSDFRTDGNLRRMKVDPAIHAFLTNTVRPVLAVDTALMTHARWPNVGGVLVTKDLLTKEGQLCFSNENRFARWTFGGAKIEAFGMVHAYASGGCLVKGYDAAAKTVTFKGKVGLGNRLFFHGVLEEIDEPGEWCYDAAAREIVLWPRADFRADSVVALGFHTAAQIGVTGDGVQIENLAFTAIPVRATPFLDIRDGRDCLVAGCRFSGIGGVVSYYPLPNGELVRLEGAYNTVRSCDFVDVYGCGVLVAGGERKLMKPASNVVENCFFDRCCQMRNGFSVGSVRMDGVENRISHCVIRDTREHALDYVGYGCIVEYCRMYDANLEYQDSGVVYSAGGDLQSFGCHFRYNDLSGSPGLSHGLYPDDFSSGHLIYCNVLRNVGWAAVMLSGGRNNLVSNNVCMAGAMGLHNDNRGLFWGAWADRDTWHRRNLEKYGYAAGPVADRWPVLKTWYADGTNMFGNVDNVWVYNIVIDSPNTQDQVCRDKFIPIERQVSRGNLAVGLRKAPCKDVWRFGGFSFLDMRDGRGRLFRDVPPMRLVRRLDGRDIFVYEKGDFRLADAALMRKAVPGFQPIPWEKIGLYKDAWRKVILEDRWCYAGKTRERVATGGLTGDAVVMIPFAGKRAATSPAIAAGRYFCWAEVENAAPVAINVAGADFTVPAGKGRRWVKLGETMLAAGFTAVNVKGGAAPNAVSRVALVQPCDWTPPAQ